jgi:predicted peptidase
MMLRWQRLGLALAVPLALALLPARAGDPAKHGFLDRVYKGADGVESKYVVFVPHDYKGDKAYPLILFLHGAGSTGNDGEKQAKGALGQAIRKQAKTFPFLVVFPQSQKRSWKADSEDGKRALAILAEVQKSYKVDDKRIYLTGLSMGGSGTWSLAAAHPEMWAAIVPLCGGGNPETAVKIKHLPCWVFVGDQDKGPYANNQVMVKALKTAGSSVRFEVYPGVGHNCWDRAYATPELYTWLLEHRRK